MTRSERIINWPESIKLAHGKEAVARELLDILAAELPRYRDVIKESFETKDYEELYTQVHNLNGSSCYVSVPSLRSAVYKLETAIKLKDKQQFAELVEQVALQINKVLYVYENKIYLKSDPTG
jgi:two-component system sensor histidine kinase BarA